jgi:hypothetical protein
MSALSCATSDALHAWILANTGLRVPRAAVCAHHQSPFDYLRGAYFEPSCDQVIWAPRGGGKTSLAAIATLLDLLHKPGCQVRILGGSLEQSLKMWDYLLPHIQQLAEGELENPRSTARRLRLKSGSSAAVLTQSQKSVRGLRVQKIRCDEVELFDPAVWEAAQLVTRSRERNDDGPAVTGTIEALSTLHRPFGLMQTIVEQAATKGTRVVRWCLLDVLQKCPAERECATCPLWDDCRGVAKTRCDGFFPIDDAIAMKGRVSAETWQAEMLCRRPSTRGCVFPMFDEKEHVRESPPSPINSDCEWWLAMDFGYSAPLVCLWIAVSGEQIYVIDEHVRPQQTLAAHLTEIAQRPWPKARRVACDPAGNGRNEQTAKSNVDLLREHGYAVRTRASHIADGLELVRAALRAAAGSVRLMIHPRRRRLIQAMQSYRYASETSETPLKDGTHDHPVDALRYFFVNQQTAAMKRRAY